jgi:F-type H+-transporting ATPase subunit delta
VGSSTRESVGAATAVLSAHTSVDVATGEQLLAAALVIDANTHLRAALADEVADAKDRTAIVHKVFGGYTPTAQEILVSLATGRWSSPADFVSGVERLGIRALAASAPSSVSITDELFAFSAAVTSSPELELALGNKLGSVDGKVALVRRLLEGKASTQTVAILSAIIAQPHGRKIGELVRFAAAIVAEEADSIIATVTVAESLGTAQATRLQKALAAQYGGNIQINEVVDPTILGGMRVQIGDEVIDGTIANRIADLRLQLAS